jgi:hypothetical protein
MTTTRHVIGICGLIGSGKGTIADYLTSQHNFVKISFADKLKDAVSVMFSLDRQLLEGDTHESRQWRNEPLPFWSNVFGHEVTPRFIIQRFGTECMRDSFHIDVWTQIVKQQIIDNPTTNFVLPDARFANEINMIKSFDNSQLWQTRKGDLPEWWDCAINTNNATIHDEYILHDNGTHMEVMYPSIHRSEWKWVNHDSAFDSIIRNDSTLSDLYDKVNRNI